jgi:peptide-methionine (S)-S-oxide reductase
MLMIALTLGENIEICYRADVTLAWNIDEGSRVAGSIHPAPHVGRREIQSGNPLRAKAMRSIEMTGSTERAVLAGGCFWGVQDLLRRYPGVISTRVGYSGGDVPNATYRNHGTHAEAIEIIFDPQAIGYRKLLEFFFQIHDPTTLNRQGNDRGLSYRSAIFYTTGEQKRIAEDTIADVDASGLWPGKVVTEVAAAGEFWEAEPEHQDYLERYPNGYTCHFIRPDWKLPVRSERATAAR